MQVYVQRFGYGVAAQGALHVELYPVEVYQRIVQGDGAGSPIELYVGFQPGGYAVNQQFAVLPEEYVLVVEIEGQHGMPLFQVRFQFQVGVPQVGKHSGLAVVVGDGSVAHDNAAYVNFAGDGLGAGGCIDGCRVGGHDIPVGHPVFPLEGVYVDAVES